MSDLLPFGDFLDNAFKNTKSSTTSTHQDLTNTSTLKTEQKDSLASSILIPLALTLSIILLLITISISAYCIKKFFFKKAAIKKRIYLVKLFLFQLIYQIFIFDPSLKGESSNNSNKNNNDRRSQKSNFKRFFNSKKTSGPASDCAIELKTTKFSTIELIDMDTESEEDHQLLQNIENKNLANASAPFGPANVFKSNSYIIKKNNVASKVRLYENSIV